MLPIILCLFLVTSSSLGDIDLTGIRCKLPGWPGHPAPSCDPNEKPSSCCSGTKCGADPYDATHFVCQQMDLANAVDHVKTADALWQRVDFLMAEAKREMNVAAFAVENEGSVTSLSTTQIAARAEKTAKGKEKSKDEKAGFDWTKYAHGGQPAGRGNDFEAKKSAESEKKSAQQPQQPQQKGGYDYSPFVAGQQGQQKGGAADGGAGYDYGQYIPKSGAEDKKDEKKGGKKDDKKKDDKKDDKKKDDKSSGAAASSGGNSGFDYGKYIPKSGGPPDEDKKGNKKDDKKKSVEDLTEDFEPRSYGGSNPHIGSSGHDAHETGYKPKGHESSSTLDFALPKTASLVNQANPDGLSVETASEDDFLKRAGLALLDADVQWRLRSQQTKEQVIAKVRAILQQLDRDLSKYDVRSADNNTSAPDGSMDNADSTNDSAGDDVGGVDWRSYIPDRWSDTPPDVRINAGDRRPGTLGGPCGQTSFKDFGPCHGAHTVCTETTTAKPGLCQLKHSIDMVEFSHVQVTSAIQRAEDALEDLKLAAEELLVGTVSAENNKAAIAAYNKVVGSAAASAQAVVDAPVVESEDTSGAVALVVIGFAVVGYFAWTRFAKRRRYQTIPTDGWSGTGAKV